MSDEHKPIQPDLHAIMNDLAHGLDMIFNPDPKNRQNGFALLVFPFQPSLKNRANYISNALRADMLAALKEFIARNEGRYMSPENQTPC